MSFTPETCRLQLIRDTKTHTFFLVISFCAESADGNVYLVFLAYLCSRLCCYKL